MNGRARRRVLVIGYGSTIRSDDAAGRRIAEHVRLDGVDVIAAHQLDFDMAEKVHHHDAVLFVDASREGRPGELHCRRVSAAAPDEVMTHHLTPDTLLALVRQLWGSAPEAWTLTLTGSDFALGESLSAAVRSRIRLVTAVVESAARRMECGQTPSR